MNVHGSHHAPPLRDGSHSPSPGREMHHDRFPVPARPGCRTPAGVAGPGPTPSAARRTGCRGGRVLWVGGLGAGGGALLPWQMAGAQTVGKSTLAIAYPVDVPTWDPNALSIPAIQSLYQSV